MTIKAIETRYKGYRFRSRLEARWAVFFDALGLDWRYEPEGFDLGDAGYYLPDFYLRELDQWIEVKPYSGKEPWMDDVRHERFPESLIVLFGSPGIMRPFSGEELSYVGSVIGDSSYFFCECPECGALGFQYMGRAERNDHSEGCSMTSVEDKCYAADSQRIQDAANAARSARFEYGENGAS